VRAVFSAGLAARLYGRQDACRYGAAGEQKTKLGLTGNGKIESMMEIGI
jgi:hypothetical protein